MSVYRLILESAAGRVDTGASYPGCSPDSKAACDPRQFTSVSEAMDFAHTHGETPVKVTSADEAWAVIAGRKAITPEMLMESGFSGLLSNPIALGVGALLLLKFFGK